MKVFKVLSITTVVLLLVIVTGCASVVFDNNQEKNPNFKLQKTPYINARIVAPEGFQKGAPVTENTLFEFYKDSAGINLSRSYVGENDSLDEYVKDSKERLEDDVHSFMEFSFVSIEGLEFEGDNKRAIAFEALQNKILKKFWIVYVLYNDYVFEITCYAPKDEFDSLKGDFNKAISSLEIYK